MLLVHVYILQSYIAVLNDSQPQLVFDHLWFPTFGLFVGLEDETFNQFVLVFSPHYQKIFIAISHPSLHSIELIALVWLCNYGFYVGCVWAYLIFSQPPPSNPLQVYYFWQVFCLLFFWPEKLNGAAKQTCLNHKECSKSCIYSCYLTDQSPLKQQGGAFPIRLFEEVFSNFLLSYLRDQRFRESSSLYVRNDGFFNLLFEEGS